MSDMEAPMGIDTDARAFNYYRHAVEKHWDPHEIDLATDREAIAGSTTAASRDSSARSRCSALARTP
nr:MULTISPECIES: hypothetical protein [Halococcus]